MHKIKRIDNRDQVISVYIEKHIHNDLKTEINLFALLLCTIRRITFFIHLSLAFEIYTTIQIDNNKFLNNL